MEQKPKLIVMLTQNDYTVKNAFKIFEKCKNSKAEYFGFKEEPLNINEMKKLFSYMKRENKKTILEVVSYDEESCIKGAKKAAECNCDFLMGTMYFDKVNTICKENNIKYLPFCGKIINRPSILEGTIEEIIDSAKKSIEKNIYGLDLLLYRYIGNQEELYDRLKKEINLPICVAGSIDSIERLNQIKNMQPDYFTIGSAFFENKFGESFQEQIDFVCNYITK